MQKRAHLDPDEKKLYVETTSFNDHVLENNQKHRLNKTLQTGTKAKLQPDGAEIVHVIQAPEPDWDRFKRTHRHLYRRLHSRHQFEREKAAADIRVLHPEWFVETPRTFIHGGI